MRERGIIMTGESVRAILAGAKTQTRRLVRFPVWACGCFDDPLKIEVEADEHGRDPEVICNDTGCLAALPLPYAVGDRLWVKEVWQEFLLSEHPPGRKLGPRGRFGIPAEMAKGNVSHVAYRAEGEWPDHPEMGAARWRSPIHMPRWASRLTLTVTDVRVQRLQDISEEDADAEGFAGDFPWRLAPDVFTEPHERWGELTIPECYGVLWNSIHGPGSWDRNPWVCAISFDPADRAASEGGAP